MRDGGIRHDRRLELIGSGRREGLSADGGACNAGTIAELDLPVAVDAVGVIRELAPAGTRLAITASLA